MKFKFLQSSFENQPTYYKGYDLWKIEWKSKDGINQCEEVWLDSASQKYSLNVYDAVLPNKAKIVFLAGELSNGVYGFFVPDDE